MDPLSLKFPPWMSALAVGGGVFLAPEAAHADEMHNGFSLGLTMSFSMGARPAFGIGPDLRYSLFYRPTFDPANPNGYTTSDYFSAGVFFQPTYLLGGAWRIAGGIHGGRLIEKFFMPDLEVGISYRTQIDPTTPGGYGLHLGVVPILTFLDMFPAEHGPAFRGVIALSPEVKSEFIIGHDIRSPGACFFTECITAIDGRPLRPTADCAPVRAPLLARASRRTSSNLAQRVGSNRRSRLAAHFGRDASTECASIPAFLALARDLARAGAPAALVAQAQQSAREEATHTRLCAQLAGEFGGVDLQALVPPVPTLFDPDEPSLLKRLAVESFWDGCVGEGAAAAGAQRRRETTMLTSVADALAIIARDEKTHADLSAQIVAFCIDRGGSSVRNALHESFEQRMRAEEEALAAGPVHDAEESLEDAGVAGDAMLRLAREEALEKSRTLLA